MLAPTAEEGRQTMLGVRARPTAWLALGLWLLSVGLAVSAAVIPGRGGGGFGTLLALWALANATVGTIVAIRRPAHRIGWLLVAIGLLLAVDSFAEQYARYGLLAGVDSSPAVPAMAWVSFWLDAPALFLLLFVILLFPDGHLPSRRWRPVAWLLAIAAAAGAGVALRPGELPELAPIRNPFGVRGVTPTLELLETGSLFIFAGVVAALAVSLLQRLPRAQGLERSQLKWFAYAVALVGVSLAVHLAALAAGLPLVESATLVVLLIAILGVPVAVGIAVLRYRLYDIDRLINRTLVYGLLTALLAGVYATVVLVMGQMFAGWARIRRAGRRPVRPWRWRRCSSPPVAASSRRSTDASTGASTTSPGLSRRSAPGCATRSTSTRSRLSCSPWSTRPWSQRRCRCGCDHGEPLLAAMGH
jgi:hypothetical protein